MSCTHFFDSKGSEVFDFEICIERSSVDSFIEAAYYANGEKVPDEELEYLQDEYSDYVQEYSYENGSINHN